MDISIPITVTEQAGVGRMAEGVHSGIPLARGMVQSLEELELVDEQGQAVAAQLETLSRWHDGSQRWVLVNIVESLEPEQSKEYSLNSRQNGATPTPSEQGVSV